MTTNHTDHDGPTLYPTRYKRPAPNTWRPTGLEPLPPGWVNVRVWSYDRVLGVNLWVTDDCPGVLHEDNTVTETVLSWADADGEVINEYGELYDHHPVVVATTTAEPPWRRQDFTDPDWRPAVVGGGYLGTCPRDLISELLAEHDMADAVPRPDGWRHPDYDGLGDDNDGILG